MAKKLALRGPAILFYSGTLLLLVLGMLMTQPLKAEKTETNKVFLIPIGQIDHAVLKYLQQELGVRFNKEVAITSALSHPHYAYSADRHQYSSSSILRELSSRISNYDCEKALGIVDVDMNVPGLNFVFGEAELGGKTAVISLMRLRQEFYKLSSDHGLFLERALKEATHELGHCFRLRHCSDPSCVMCFSNSIADTDRNSSFFCTSCRKTLEKSE